MKCIDVKELSLKKVTINGNVIGKFGTFEVEQTFINNKKSVLEVLYTFPLIASSTVAGFEVEVGGKLLKGVSKEITEAKKEYTENIVKGNSAYLMEQHEDNIFTINIGKLDTKEEVKIKIFFISTFEVVDNQIQVLIPTLVTPRYKSELTKKLKYGKVDYTIDFNITVPKCLKCSEIFSPSHKISVINEEENQIIKVSNYDMSKDFKLYLKLKEEALSMAFVSKLSNGQDIAYLSFMPEIIDNYEDSEKEYIFLIDVSGSMYGNNIEETKKAVIECLMKLDAGDRFNIVSFWHDYTPWQMSSVEYNEENLKQAIEYVKNLEADGGTEMFNPIKFALYDDECDKEFEKVVLLFTDGQVGYNEENDIIDFVDKCDATFRIFPFGIDSNVNEEFIRDLARAGFGKAEFIQPNEPIEDKILRQFARIQTPLIDDIKVDYGKAKILDEMKESNSLFNYEYYNVFVKGKNIIDNLHNNVALRGKIGDDYYVLNIDNVIESSVDLERIFAKCMIDRHEEYIRRGIGDKKSHKKAIIKLATKYNINSPYTSFITVYEREDKIFELPKLEQTTLSYKFADLTNASDNMVYQLYCDGNRNIRTLREANIEGLNKFSKKCSPCVYLYINKEELNSIALALTEQEKNFLNLYYDFDKKSISKSIKEISKTLKISEQATNELQVSCINKVTKYSKVKRLFDKEQNNKYDVSIMLSELFAKNQNLTLSEVIIYAKYVLEKMEEYSNELKMNDIKLKDYLKDIAVNYYSKFIKEDYKNIEVYLLFAIFAIRTGYIKFDFNELLKYLIEQKLYILEDIDIHSDIQIYITMLYKELENNNIINRDKFLEFLLPAYKKRLLCGMVQELDFEPDFFWSAEMIFENNIDNYEHEITGILWLLINYSE